MLDLGIIRKFLQARVLRFEYINKTSKLCSTMKTLIMHTAYLKNYWIHLENETVILELKN